MRRVLGGIGNRMLGQTTIRINRTRSPDSVVVRPIPDAHRTKNPSSSNTVASAAPAVPLTPQRARREPGHAARVLTADLGLSVSSATT